MKFIPLTASLSGEWDKIIEVSDDAWFFHLYEWLELEEKVWDLERKSFLIEHEDKFIGMVPLQMNKRNKFLKSDLRGASGVALINGLEPSFRDKVLKESYQHIEAIARDNHSPGVEIYLPPLAESQLKDRWQINPLINSYYTDISTQTLLIDLTQSEEAIIADFSRVARLQIKDAEKGGYTVRQASGIERYYEVHCENYRRTGASPHPKGFFEGIEGRMVQHGHAVIWEAIDANQEPVAFHILAIFKKKVLSWTRCCRTAHLNSGVNYLLQMHSILWAKAQGAQWFDTGEVFPNALDGKEKGLTDFKVKFGGQLHRFFKGRQELLIPANNPKIFKNWVRASVALLKQLAGRKEQ